MAQRDSQKRQSNLSNRQLLYKVSFIVLHLILNILVVFVSGNYLFISELHFKHLPELNVRMHL